MTHASFKKQATLRDVAEKSGVSLMTVSRVIANPDIVAAATKEKVLKAIQQTGYIPNLLAGGLKSKRSLTVAGLVPNISVPQFLPTIRELTDRLGEQGYQFILGQPGYDHSREDALIHTMLGRRPDGLVITGLVQSPAMRAKLKKLGIPVVETWDMTDRPIDMLVGFSHIAVGQAVARYFQCKGWQRIGIVTGNDQRAARRNQGFTEVMGRDFPTVTITPPGTVSAGRQGLVDLLRMDSQLEAVFCSSDSLAQGVMIEAMQRGQRIPEDLAVCGFGDADFSAYLTPSLTSVQVDGAGMGRLAAQLILNRCQNLPITDKIIDLGFSIIERDSTRFC